MVTALSKSLIRPAGFALLMIFVMELGSRVLGLAPPANPETDVALVLHYTDPNGRVRMTPNWECTVGFVRMRVNDRGFRDRVYTPTPPENAASRLCSITTNTGSTTCSVYFV